MLKQIAVFLILVLSFAFVGGILAQNDVATLPFSCQNVDAGSDVIIIGVPGEVVPSGVVGCRVIYDGSAYLLSPAVIGNLDVIRSGVQSAVDVFGISGGSAVTNFGQQVLVCLRGSGTFIFLNGNSSPRVPSAMPASSIQSNGTTYTCTYISSSGVAVLVAGPAATLTDFATLIGSGAGSGDTPTTTTVTNPDGTVSTVVAPIAPVTTTVGGAVPLSGCRVTTTAQVRLRTEPTTGSEVITRLPFQFTLQATARLDGWIQVIYQDRQGWISENYLNQSAGCTG